MDWAHSRNIGFSRLIALGSMSDVDFGDMLDELAEDDTTRAILLYIEAVKQPRKFLSAARAAARNKPVIVCKSGRHPAGARAAASHTGALVGADAVYDCAFRRAGMLRVRIMPAAEPGSSRLAIRPYPEELFRRLIDAAGTSLEVRPVRPDDTDRIRDFAACSGCYSRKPPRAASSGCTHRSMRTVNSLRSSALLDSTMRGCSCRSRSDFTPAL
ncbi:MAG: hypothetical protein EA417_19380 [Gammaproteobacteria bacterium]|nr:MAG: hypothetical protein EA417_19380 [Gammaproteobacteria bacterium]